MAGPGEKPAWTNPGKHEGKAVPQAVADLPESGNARNHHRVRDLTHLGLSESCFPGNDLSPFSLLIPAG